MEKANDLSMSFENFSEDTVISKELVIQLMIRVDKLEA